MDIACLLLWHVFFGGMGRSCIWDRVMTAGAVINVTIIAGASRPSEQEVTHKQAVY